MMDFDGWMAGMMGWMMLWGLVGLALLVLAVLVAVRLVRRSSSEQRDEAHGQRDERPNAQELLRRRYAAGEIDREEYLRMQRDLTGG